MTAWETLDELQQLGQDVFQTKGKDTENDDIETGMFKAGQNRKGNNHNNNRKRDV